jgi:hypothetical protein
MNSEQINVMPFSVKNRSEKFRIERVASLMIERTLINSDDINFTQLTHEDEYYDDSMFY